MRFDNHSSVDTLPSSVCHFSHRDPSNLFISPALVPPRHYHQLRPMTGSRQVLHRPPRKLVYLRRHPPPPPHTPSLTLTIPSCTPTPLLTLTLFSIRQARYHLQG